MNSTDDGRWVRQAEDFFALAQRQHHQGKPAAEGLSKLSGLRSDPALLERLRGAVVDERPLLWRLVDEPPACLMASLRVALWPCRSLGDPVA